MRHIILMILSILFIQTVHADDYAKLRIRISGAMADNRYFLCVGNVGCVSIEDGDQGRTYPMNTGDIDYIYTTNLTNLRLYPQPLPDSCKVSIQSGQTVTVSGQITKGPNQTMYIRNLNCKVA